MGTDFRVTIHDEARRALWQGWIGTDTVCVRTPIAQPVVVPVHGQTRGYILDQTQLTDAQRAALARGIAAQFGAAVQDVLEEMHGAGIVILADQCSVSVRNPARWLI